MFILFCLNECHTGQVCDNGACVTPPPVHFGTTPGKPTECSSNADCPSGQVCIGNTGKCGPCTSSEQCDPDQFCDDVIGLCQFEQ